MSERELADELSGETLSTLVSRLSDMLVPDTDFDNYSFSIKRGNLRRILAALRSPPSDATIEAVAELQLTAFLAGRGSVKSIQYGIRSASPGPTMDDYRNMAITALTETGEQTDD